MIGIFYGNEVSFVTSENNDCDVVYLDDNGVTIKAYPCANIGDIGTIDGVEYTVVDNEMLFQMRGDFGQIITADFTKLCTTRVTNMSGLFLCYEEFNQPIGNWDISNVTDTSLMFYGECAFHLFNQNISHWDVSNVNDMNAMFFNGYFNQNISQWDVSNVTDMYSMFNYAYSFNQDLSNWDVENVTSCAYFSLGASAWTLPQPNFTNCNPN